MFLVRFLQAVIVLCIVGIILVLFQSGATSARQGVFVRDYVGYNSSQVVTFDNPEVARSFYGELKGLGRPALFSFKATKATYLNAKIYLPRLEGLDDFRPGLALFGPGLPKPAADQLEQLPFTLPPEAGMIISEQFISPSATMSPPPEFNEPFTQSGYWEGQELIREIPEDGTYYLVVFSRIGQGGKYALHVGDKAEIGPKEILGFPVLWNRVNLWFGKWPIVVLVWLGLALLVLYTLYRWVIQPPLKRWRKFKTVTVSEQVLDVGEGENSRVQPPPTEQKQLPEYSGRVSKYAPAPKIKVETEFMTNEEEQEEQAEDKTAQPSKVKREA